MLPDGTAISRALALIYIYHSCLHYGYLSSGGQWELIYEEKEEKVSVEGVLCCNNGEVLRDAAIKGLGIVILPTFIVEKYLNNG